MPRAASAADDPVDPERLGRARERRWWIAGRRVRSIERAGAFVDDVGFALLFPADRVLVPSLWEAVAGADVEPFATGMESNEKRVWAWKDELPHRGLAWYGNFVASRGSFLSPALLRMLYPSYGDVGDHEELQLSNVAHEIAGALAEGPLSSATLRSLVGDRNRYQRGIAELQRSLLVTNAGVEEQPSGWPAVVVDLTCRRFDVGDGLDHEAAADTFLRVVLEASAGDLARAFRWPVAMARRHLDALVATGAASRSATGYRALE
jgi:hypothetical protein